MASGALLVEYDYCTVFDGLEANRCFKCNSFGHSSCVCKEKFSCRRCSGEYGLSECKAEKLKCKCEEMDTVHPIWDQPALYAMGSRKAEN